MTAAREAQLGTAEFNAIKRFIFDVAGIHLTEAKKALVTGRLAKRLRARNLDNYGDYLKLIAHDEGERQIALDQLTTNETYFFREPQHFAHLRDVVLPQRPRGQPFRVWSAASSSGEEAYSTAMLLAAELKEAPWEIVGTDISSKVVAQAKAGRYPLARSHHIPPAYLRAYCLKGTGPEEGNLLINKRLRQKVRFLEANLNATLPDLGPPFDLVLLRNVMIYFQPETKRALVARLLEKLRPGGWMYIGHSESLNGLTESVVQVQPAIFRKP
jgi:chemotaxis protein methyltransferase CheR